MSRAPGAEEDLPSPRRGALPVPPSVLEQATPFVPGPEDDEDRPGAPPAPPEEADGADD